ncbi:NAD-dependent epimerase/dehydratase family protein [Chthonobacter rhizosphaerae]|uniref:NAD-dependent epimerase/dehydratase family protein n=1 Tax=Chthonobacter rhizosphaerae TaxID=2735553 RepID=UPI0015EEB500|nr:NAD-dependent epimerase/dehydratase family protein [Chthonobacter rhizosphaerae]
MTNNKKILVIGATNAAGLLARDTLRCTGAQVVAVDSDIANAISKSEIVRPLDLTDLRAVDAMCRGVDLIVNMAGMGSPMDSGNDLTNAISAISNIFEAARINGVKRVVAAAPDAVVGLYRRSAVLDHLSLPRPDSRRGVAGAMQESIAALYAYKHDVTALCIRMGTLAPEPANERALSTWISPDDFRRLIRMGITADYCFEVVYGVSANTRGWWDNSNAIRLGYRPQDNAEVFAEALRGDRPADMVTTVLQGSRASEGFSGDLKRIP